MPSPRRSTPPRSTRRNKKRRRTASNSRVPTLTTGARPRPKKTRKRTAKKNKRKSNRKRASSDRRLPFWGKLLFMAGLGFLVITGIDALARVDLGPVSEIAEKLLDRFLDRDMPTVRGRDKPAPKKTPAPPAAKKPAPPPRADEPAPPPDEYSRDSQPAPRQKTRAEQERQKLDDLIERVTSQL